MTPAKSKLLAIPTINLRLWGQIAIAVLLCGSIARGTALSASAAAGRQPAAEATKEAVLKAFLKRIDEYVALKKRLTAGVPSPRPGDRGTGKVERAGDTLASRLKGARAEAKPGDMFGEAAPYFKQIIEHDTETRGVRDAYAAMQEVPAQSPPAVNALYPEKAALATVPPLILVNLPRLPDGLEYRFMGRDLILRDRDANIIVDFVPGAVPVIKR